MTPSQASALHSMDLAKYGWASVRSEKMFVGNFQRLFSAASDV
jgi:hypothetical protein